MKLHNIALLILITVVVHAMVLTCENGRVAEMNRFSIIVGVHLTFIDRLRVFRRWFFGRIDLAAISILLHLSKFIWGSHSTFSSSKSLLVVILIVTCFQAISSFIHQNADIRKIVRSISFVSISIYVLL